jgi:hypothetical protein
MTGVESVSIDVRGITEEEIAHFREKGWAHLRGLVSQDAAHELLRRAQERMGADAERDDVPERNTLGRVADQFRTYYKIDEDDTLFRALRTHPRMGENAARLFGRDMAIRSGTTLVAPKLPAKLAGTTHGAGVTGWHQDFNAPTHGNTIGFWLALDRATPEMGTMRFREGSHKLGWLAPPVEDWPAVHDLPLSESVTMAPGDATVHAQLTIHGAPENRTDSTRWGYIFSYFPAHATFLGMPSHHTDGLGLKAGQPLDHPNFPLVYEPSDS